MYSKIHLTEQTAPDDLSDDNIAQANDVMTSLVAGAMEYLELQPSTGVIGPSQRRTDPVTEKDLTQMLLLNIFNGCAMTYRGCETRDISELNGTESSISGQPCIRFFTGSSYEGIGCASPSEYSDLDTMHVLRNFKVIMSSESDTLPECTTGTDDLADIGALLNGKEKQNKNTAGIGTNSQHDTSERTAHKSKRQHNIDDKTDINPRRPSGSIKVLKTGKNKHPGYISLVADTVESEVREITKSLNYGPVIRRDEIEMLLAHKFEYDDAIAVECNSWPVEACDWDSRTRPASWPGHTLVQKCRKTPCYIVRKPHANNLDDQHEWRFSFARQEAMLLRTLTVQTKMIYILTKMLMKASVLQENCLTTYHLKTLFLWFLERYPVDHFAYCGLEDSIKDFLNFILQHVIDHRFPNYFLPGNNMISHIAKDDVEKVKEQVENILANFTAALATIKTAHVYPFSTRSIAEHITDDPSLRSRCLAMLHSNFLSTIIDHLSSILVPNWNVVWMYCRYFAILVESHGKAKSHMGIAEALKIMATTQKDAKLVYQIYRDSFIRIGMVYCNYIDQKLPDISFVSKQLLACLVEMQDNSLAKVKCMADVTSTISIQHGVRATESCCNLLKHVIQPGEPVRTFFMLTMKEMLRFTEGGEVKAEGHYLIGCLAAIVNTLQVPKDDIEVGMTASLRLNRSKEPITLLASILRGVSMKGVLKQFAYLWVLYVEEDIEKQRTPDDVDEVQGLDSARESNKALTAVMKLCTENLPKTNAHADTFKFVVAIIVFQKMTLDEPNIELVARILQDLRSSSISKRLPDLEELETDITSLIQTGTVDMNFVFMFAVSYTIEGVLSVGVDFVLSVLDELTKPHFNLGILAVIWEELLSSGALSESMVVMETWITRATGAPISQNPRLTVQMYGKLGHLYHVQALSKGETEEGTLKKKMAHVMFRTALKEKVEHPAVIIDFLLLIWEEISDEFTKYLGQVLKSNDVYCVSSFFPHSAAVLSHMTELHAVVVSRKVTKISSVVFAHYIAVHKEKHALVKSVDVEALKEPLEHVNEMIKVVGSLELTVKNMEMSEANSEGLIGSNLVLGFAACQLGISDIAMKAFTRVLELDPTCQTATAKMQEISVKEEGVCVLYSREGTSPTGKQIMFENTLKVSKATTKWYIFSGLLDRWLHNAACYIATTNISMVEEDPSACMNSYSA